MAFVGRSIRCGPRQFLPRGVACCATITQLPSRLAQTAVYRRWVLEVAPFASVQVAALVIPLEMKMRIELDQIRSDSRNDKCLKADGTPQKLGEPDFGFLHDFDRQACGNEERNAALVIVSATYMYCYVRMEFCVLRALDVMNANSGPSCS